MRTIDLADLLSALRDVDPDDLASALYTDRDSQFLADLIDTVARAAEQRTFYPHEDVVTAGDAALYTVLTWPVADALGPNRALPTADRLAALRGTDAPRAQALLDRIAATENLAAQQLVSSGVDVTFTAEQICITAAIRGALAEGVTPTRASVRSFCESRAAQAMRDSQPPVVHNTSGLPPRILSPSPYALVPCWLDRMEASPPAACILDDELRYIGDAWSTMRRSARGAARLREASQARHREPGRGTPLGPICQSGAGLTSFSVVM